MKNIHALRNTCIYSRSSPGASLDAGFPTAAKNLLPYLPNEVIINSIKMFSYPSELFVNQQRWWDPVETVSANIQNVEKYVGQRIRERRTMLGLTQQQLAEMIGVTYQQAHKYERGINRVSAGRLFEIAKVLGVDIGFFYEGLNSEDSRLNERQRMCLDLARNFTRISNDRHQEAVSQLCRVLADGATH